MLRMYTGAVLLFSLTLYLRCEVTLGDVPFTACPLDCCAGGSLNSTSDCSPYAPAENCSCLVICETLGNCCHNYYQTCLGESCPPFPTWYNIETSDELSINNSVHMGDVLNYYCKPGYSYSSSVSAVQTSRCVGPSGTWQPEIQQCYESTGDDSSPAEGRYFPIIVVFVGGAVAFQIFVFCVMDSADYVSQGRKCVKRLREKRKEPSTRKASTSERRLFSWPDNEVIGRDNPGFNQHRPHNYHKLPNKGSAGTTDLLR